MTRARHTIILVVPANPAVIRVPNASLAAFIIAIFVLAFLVGFIKPPLVPLLCDQSQVKEPTIAYLGSQRVIIDPQKIVKRYPLIFSGCINIGSLFTVVTQYSTRLVGFRLAYLLPGIFNMPMPLVLAWASLGLVKLLPQGSVLPDARGRLPSPPE